MSSEFNRNLAMWSEFVGFDEEDDFDDCGCEFDEHDWEPVLVDGGFYCVYECVRCGLIDGL